jgi:hypothetical protein
VGIHGQLRADHKPPCANLSDRETVDFVVVRSGNEGYVTKLDAVPVEQTGTVFQASRRS